MHDERIVGMIASDVDQVELRAAELDGLLVVDDFIRNDDVGIFHLE